MEIIKLLLELLFAHMIGDYVLQIDFIAKSKGTNLYHLFVHCVLYCVPFYLFFGLTWHIAIVFITHIVIDILKARYKKINYVVDQILHYIVCLIYLI